MRVLTASYGCGKGSLSRDRDCSAEHEAGRKRKENAHICIAPDNRSRTSSRLMQMRCEELEVSAPNEQVKENKRWLDEYFRCAQDAMFEAHLQLRTELSRLMTRFQTMALDFSAATGHAVVV